MTAIYGNKGGELSRAEVDASTEKRALQRVMIGHGALMIATALLGGVGLWMFLLGGFEIIPGYIIHFQLPGSAEGWRKAHSGPVLNGLMVIGIAFGPAKVEAIRGAVAGKVIHALVTDRATAEALLAPKPI